MLKNKRHAEILEILRLQGFASVRDLGERLYASQPTIRRDLEYLERYGYIRRNHGGAALADDKVNTPVPFRKGKMAKEKMSICRLAATLIQPGQLIFADASTTVFFLSSWLREEMDVTVVTNGSSLCRTLSQNRVRAFSTGGRLVRESEAFVGAIAERVAGSFNANYMFFSSSSLDENGMISDYSEEEISLRAIMREKSAQTVFLCDSGKLGSRSAFCVHSLAEVDYFVTDKRIPEDLAARFSLVLCAEDEGAVMYKKS